MKTSSTTLGILVPVWHGYEAIAPLTFWALGQFWPQHPPLWFCGLKTPGSLPALDWDSGIDRTNWTAVLLSGARQLLARGFERVYLVPEEHIPLAPCHEGHLNETLPRLMDDLPAVYISLMGWDNRRYTSKSPVLDRGKFRLKHLVRDRDPRFHLHPALWRLEALEACCELALRDPAKGGSAWHFEKVNDRDETPHPQEWKKQCYQICAAAMRRNPPGLRESARAAAERWIFHKLMALYPRIPGRDAANAFARAMRFDDFFCEGPYPMFYSGLMVKGALNPYAVGFLRRRNPALLDRVREAVS